MTARMAITKQEDTVDEVVTHLTSAIDDAFVDLSTVEQLHALRAMRDLINERHDEVIAELVGDGGEPYGDDSDDADDDATEES